MNKRLFNLKMCPEKLTEILNNNTSGSAELLAELIDFFIDELEKKSGIDKYFDVVRNRMSEFAAIINLIDALAAFSDNALKLDYLRKTKENSKNTYEKIYSKFKKTLFNGANIITISNSKTLTEIFALAAKDFNDLKIFVSESRPVFEGKTLAKNLAELGLRTTLITEAMIPAYVQKCDIAVIGADKILRNGDVVNKIGSLTIALACAYYGKPFWVLTSKNKFTNETIFKETPHPRNEIADDNEGYSVAENVYFETIPDELITGIISD